MDEKNNKNIILSKEQKTNDLNTYSQNDKNIHKSEYFVMKIISIL